MERLLVIVLFLGVLLVLDALATAFGAESREPKQGDWIR